MERRPLGPGSRRRRLATTCRTPGGLEMHVIHEPAAAVRLDQVHRHHLIATRALELHPICPQLLVPRHEERSFDDPVPAVVEILLNHGEALAENVAVHRLRCGAALGAPQLAHAFQIVRLDRRKKLRNRFVHRLRDRRLRSLPIATGRQSGEQDNMNREPSLHEASPVVGMIRR